MKAVTILWLANMIRTEKGGVKGQQTNPYKILMIALPFIRCCVSKSVSEGLIYVLVLKQSFKAFAAMSSIIIL